MESFPAEVHGLRVWSFGRPSLVNNAQAAAAAASSPLPQRTFASVAQTPPDQPEQIHILVDALPSRSSTAPYQHSYGPQVWCSHDSRRKQALRCIHSTYTQRRVQDVGILYNPMVFLLCLLTGVTTIRSESVSHSGYVENLGLFPTKPNHVRLG